ncbi:chloride intracellular channel protein 2, partial [Heterocephalus glaber]|uniref:Chloride intracellular channel protein n=1 Tax=Heterocephalus glaber TaxID=10181 RepID=A0AAX6SHW9_HETGA
CPARFPSDYLRNHQALPSPRRTPMYISGTPCLELAGVAQAPTFLEPLDTTGRRVHGISASAGGRGLKTGSKNKKMASPSTQADPEIELFVKHRKPEELKDLAPGTNPPFLVYNKELKTDFIKIEEFLEQTLAPPRYPHLSPKYKESFDAGCNLFAKFSAYIKNTQKEANKNFEKNLLKEFKRLDDYLNTPLLDEIDLDSAEELTVSRRLFLDGDQLTLADCSLLPKLNIIKVAAKKYRDFDIPEEFSGVWRYLHNAYAREEFIHTCPEDKEIENTYASVAKQN